VSAAEPPRAPPTAPHAGPGPADDVENRDPGLARERTDLAWTRTAISFSALGAVMLRTSPVAGALILAGAAAVWILGRLSALATRSARYRRLGHPRILLLITTATTLMSAVTLALALLAPGSGHH
jgi:uncharacterized membrane protein YidH (DUF202 family)